MCIVFVLLLCVLNNKNILKYLSHYTKIMCFMNFHGSFDTDFTHSLETHSIYNVHLIYLILPIPATTLCFSLTGRELLSFARHADYKTHRSLTYFFFFFSDATFVRGALKKPSRLKGGQFQKKNTA